MSRSLTEISSSSFAMIGSRSRTAWSRTRSMTRRVTSGGDERVAVAVAADPGAERQRPGVGGQRDAHRLEREREVVEHLGHRPVGEVVEVVERVARLVEHLGTVQAQLVGLPQQVDSPRATRESSRPVRRLGAVEQVGDRAQLEQHRAPRGLGGVRGEDRSRREPAERGRDLVGRDVAGGQRRADPSRRRRRGGRPGTPGRLLLPRAVHLLGDVGQVEVRRERPGQGGGLS